LSCRRHGPPSSPPRRSSSSRRSRAGLCPRSRRRSPSWRSGGSPRRRRDRPRSPSWRSGGSPRRRRDRPRSPSWRSGGSPRRRRGRPWSRGGSSRSRAPPGEREPVGNALIEQRACSRRSIESIFLLQRLHVAFRFLHSRRPPAFSFCLVLLHHPIPVRNPVRVLAEHVGQCGTFGFVLFGLVDRVEEGHVRG
jgi:hypothetical protein